MDDVTEKKYYKICKQNIQWKTQKKKSLFSQSTGRDKAYC
jgi:hypothetical protein